MAQQDLGEWQLIVDQLTTGSPSVLFFKSSAPIIPSVMMLLLKNNMFTEFDNMLERIMSGSRAIDKDHRLIATTCFVKTARSLAESEYNELKYLQKMARGLKTIAGSPVYEGQHRSMAASVLAELDAAAALSADETNLSQDPTITKANLATQEKRILQLATDGKKDIAIKQLLGLVVSCAKKKDFDNAERLRKLIYEIDPLALMEMIQSGNIIEQEKGESFTKNKEQIWLDLRRKINGKDFDYLYHSLEERLCSDQETFVTQGADNEELYFIDSGRVRISYARSGKEHFLKHLDSGTIIGDNFFHASIWTVSLTSEGMTKVLVLNRNKIPVLEKKAPEIESRLLDYYRHTAADTYKMLRARGIERRVYERFRFSRFVRMQVFDDQGNIIGSFKGEMKDISQGGLASLVRIVKKENSRLFLGRKIQVNMPIRYTEKKIPLNGTVLGILPNDLVASFFSIHVKFNKELDRRNIQGIIGEYHAYIK